MACVGVMYLTSTVSDIVNLVIIVAVQTSFNLWVCLTIFVLAVLVGHIRMTIPAADMFNSMSSS